MTPSSGQIQSLGIVIMVSASQKGGREKRCLLKGEKKGDWKKAGVQGKRESNCRSKSRWLRVPQRSSRSRRTRGFVIPRGTILRSFQGKPSSIRKQGKQKARGQKIEEGVLKKLMRSSRYEVVGKKICLGRDLCGVVHDNTRTQGLSW